MTSTRRLQGTILEKHRPTAKPAFLLTLVCMISLAAGQPVRTKAFKELHRFTGGVGGGIPLAALIRDGAGNLYGTTYQGGDFYYGVVFKVDTAGEETVLHSFTGADGMWPVGSLVRD